MERVCFDILRAHEVVSQKTDIFFVVCKKIKFDAKNGLRDIFLCFYIDQKKYLFSTKLGVTS